MINRRRNICVKFLLIAIVGFFCFSAPVYAEDACDITGVSDPLICGTKTSNEEAALQNKIKNVLETVYLWIGIIAVVVIVIGGIKYMTSSGEPEKIKGAKNTIMYSLIGLIVTIGAFAITEAVTGALDGKTSGGTVADSGGEDDKIKHIQVVGIGTMTHDTEYGFRAKIIPDYAKYKKVSWSSSNTKVAKVTKTGRVKALKPGKTTITVNIDGKKAKKVVTVLKPIEVTKVSISAPPSIVANGTSTELSALVLPYNAENKSIKWSLDKAGKKIASINQNGVVKLKKDKKGNYKTGTIKVTAKAANGVKETASILVKEKAKEGEVSQDRVKSLQDTVKRYAWPVCHKGEYCRTHAKKAYAEASSKFKTGNGNIYDDWANGIPGSACVSYVITVMRDSGWDSRFVVGSVSSGAVSNYFANSSKWHNVTNKLIDKSTKPQPGDVILYHGGSGNTNHILLYSGKIDGFSSTTTSASLGGWVPQSDGHSIWSYINWGYKIWRYIQ